MTMMGSQCQSSQPLECEYFENTVECTNNVYITTAGQDCGLRRDSGGGFREIYCEDRSKWKNVQVGPVMHQDDVDALLSRKPNAVKNFIKSLNKQLEKGPDCGPKSENSRQRPEGANEPLRGSKNCSFERITKKVNRIYSFSTIDPATSIENERGYEKGPHAELGGYERGCKLVDRVVAETTFGVDRNGNITREFGHDGMVTKDSWYNGFGDDFVRVKSASPMAEIPSLMAANGEFERSFNGDHMLVQGFNASRCNDRFGDFGDGRYGSQCGSGNLYKCSEYGREIQGSPGNSFGFPVPMDGRDRLINGGLVGYDGATAPEGFTHRSNTFGEFARRPNFMEMNKSTSDICHDSYRDLVEHGRSPYGMSSPGASSPFDISSQYGTCSPYIFPERALDISRNTPMVSPSNYAHSAGNTPYASNIAWRGYECRDSEHQMGSISEHDEAIVDDVDLIHARFMGMNENTASPSLAKLGHPREALLNGQYGGIGMDEYGVDAGQRWDYNDECAFGSASSQGYPQYVEMVTNIPVLSGSYNEQSAEPSEDERDTPKNSIKSILKYAINNNFLHSLSSLPEFVNMLLPEHNKRKRMNLRNVKVTNSGWAWVQSSKTHRWVPKFISLVYTTSTQRMCNTYSLETKRQEGASARWRRGMDSRADSTRNKNGFWDIYKVYSALNDVTSVMPPLRSLTHSVYPSVIDAMGAGMQSTNTENRRIPSGSTLYLCILNEEPIDIPAAIANGDYLEIMQVDTKTIPFTRQMAPTSWLSGFIARTIGKEPLNLVVIPLEDGFECNFIPLCAARFEYSLSYKMQCARRNRVDREYDKWLFNLWEYVVRTSDKHAELNRGYTCSSGAQNGSTGGDSGEHTQRNDNAWKIRNMFNRLGNAIGSIFWFSKDRMARSCIDDMGEDEVVKDDLRR
ncbi:hypothetical protein BEWA_046890 [Theileria equi strain WA]|uniref:Uncharacterized protein n=1 Tax=Theileria equi strain WA TaxID=1537102 RepID=L1LAD7_THEEQ|nr:hypothetical protein BEWA_046890 [Theileria equi strain WA]EKX72225.1 hypothetical protein BEWA_046890 [Theileria equi strain WA]|eukprot:XP_004831677.1 hypothetical protein BEWA_046890 [Theileria equi strain WA]